MVRLFGEYLKGLREERGLLQREIASHLKIDTPMLSKIESGERKMKKLQVQLIADLFGMEYEKLLGYWLADQVYDIVKDEKVGKTALKIASRKIK